VRSGGIAHEGNGRITRKTKQVKLNRKVFVQLQGSTNVHYDWHASMHFIFAPAVDALCET
jgi:hypothetical protein